MRALKAQLLIKYYTYADCNYNVIIDEDIRYEQNERIKNI